MVTPPWFARAPVPGSLSPGNTPDDYIMDDEEDFYTLYEQRPGQVQPQQQQQPQNSFKNRYPDSCYKKPPCPLPSAQSAHAQPQRCGSSSSASSTSSGCDDFDLPSGKQTISKCRPLK